MKRCPGEGTIQRLLDGELPLPSLHSTKAHLEDCPSCVEAAREAEREGAFISSLFAPQLFEAIPTERLWGRILDALSCDSSIEGCE